MGASGISGPDTQRTLEAICRFRPRSNPRHCVWPSGTGRTRDINSLCAGVPRIHEQPRNKARPLLTIFRSCAIILETHCP
jgi:hypothetical protein